MRGNIQQGLGKAKNVSLTDFDTIDEYNIWTNNNPNYIIYDIQFPSKSHSMHPYKIVVIYLKVNE